MRDHKRNLVAVLLLVGLLGCQESDSSQIGQTDAGMDSGDGDEPVDGGKDAGPDAQADASDDGGDPDGGDASGLCEAAAELVPGEKLIGVTCKGQNDLQRYACSALEETGPDLAYSFTSEEGGPVVATATLTGLTADLDLFLLLDSCSDQACVAHSAGPAKETASTVLLPHQTVFVSVDGYKGTCGSFRLELSLAPVELVCDDKVDDDEDGLTDCADPDCVWADECAKTCMPNESISCNDAQVDSTQNQLNTMEFYADYPIPLSGPEWIYRLDDLSSGMELVATLAEESSALDILLLEGDCISNAVVAAGPQSLTWNPRPDATYYLVVDGRDQAQGSFGISAKCRETSCDDSADNDRDGLLDCDDPDCELYPGCVVLCHPLFTPICPETDDDVTRACYLLSPAPLLGFCHEPGDLGPGERCEMPYDCAPGHTCVPADVCHKTCDLESEAATCDPNGFCISIGAGRLGVCI